MRLVDINKKLKEEYGCLNGTDPNFRIVWSADQYENRFGEYEDWYGHIFLRSFRGIRRVQKYQEDPPSYVLERLLPNQMHTELVGVFLTYEPLFFFKRGDQQLPLEWRAIEMIMWTVLYGPRRASEMAIGSEKRKQKEYERTLDFIQEESPYLVGMFEAGQAIVNPYGKEKFGGVQ